MKLFVDKVATPVQLRVFNIAKNWVCLPPLFFLFPVFHVFSAVSTLQLDKHYYDFKSDPQASEQMDAFINNILEKKNGNFATQLRKIIAKNKEKAEPARVRPVFD